MKKFKTHTLKTVGQHLRAIQKFHTWQEEVCGQMEEKKPFQHPVLMDGTLLLQKKAIPTSMIGKYDYKPLLSSNLIHDFDKLSTILRAKWVPYYACQYTAI